MTYDAIRLGLLAQLSDETIIQAFYDHAELTRQGDALMLAAIDSGAPAADLRELVRGQRLMLAGNYTGILGALHIYFAAQRSPALAEALTRAYVPE